MPERYHHHREFPGEGEQITETGPLLRLIHNQKGLSTFRMRRRRLREVLEKAMEMKRLKRERSPLNSANESLKMLTMTMMMTTLP